MDRTRLIGFVTTVYVYLPSFTKPTHARGTSLSNEGQRLAKVQPSGRRSH